MKKELLNGLTEEQIAKVNACKNSDELLRVAKEEGIELTDEQLEAVSGGAICAPECPYCKTKETVYVGQTEATSDKYVCNKCGAIVGDFGL